jgi:hypothetical protein
MMNEDLQRMIDNCLKALTEAHEGRYLPEKAERTAALFLDAQMRLADVVSSAEFKRQMAKNELERISAEKYFFIKNGSSSDKKVTEATLDHAIARDADVFKVKEELARADSDQKKWQHIMNIMSNGHIYFRNVGKNI